MTGDPEELPWSPLGSVALLTTWSDGCSRVRHFEFVTHGVRSIGIYIVLTLLARAGRLFLTLYELCIVRWLVVVERGK